MMIRGRRRHAGAWTCGDWRRATVAAVVRGFGSSGGFELRTEEASRLLENERLRAALSSYLPRVCRRVPTAKPLKRHPTLNECCCMQFWQANISMMLDWLRTPAATRRTWRLTPAPQSICWTGGGETASRRHCSSGIRELGKLRTEEKDRCRLLIARHTIASLLILPRVCRGVPIAKPLKRHPTLNECCSSGKPSTR